MFKSIDKPNSRTKKKERKKQQSTRKKEMISHDQETRILTAKRNQMEIELGLAPPTILPKNAGLYDFILPFEHWDFKIELEVSEEVPFYMFHQNENTRKIHLSLEPKTTLEVVGVDNENKCVLAIVGYEGRKQYIAIVARKQLIFASLSPRHKKTNLNSIAALYILFPFNDIEKFEWDKDCGWTEMPNATKSKQLDQASGRCHQYNDFRISYDGENWLHKLVNEPVQRSYWIRIINPDLFVWGFGTLTLFNKTSLN